jgi:hypothetical protein
MPNIDPLTVVRTPATLGAYRRYQREMWAAAQPWPVVAIVAPIGFCTA